MNTFVSVCNLCRDPETITFGERECAKIRVADNTPGKSSIALFFDVILSGPDKDAAMRLKSGDQVVVSGQLSLTEYKAKKDGKGIKKGQKMQSFQMPFGKLVQITRSPSFFESDGESDDSDAPDDSAPDLTTADTGAADGADDPTAGLY